MNAEAMKALTDLIAALEANPFKLDANREIADKGIAALKAHLASHAKLLKENEQMREWLINCDHTYMCQMTRYDLPGAKCTCGLSALRDSLKEPQPVLLKCDYCGMLVPYDKGIHRGNDEFFCSEEHMRLTT